MAGKENNSTGVSISINTSIASEYDTTNVIVNDLVTDLMNDTASTAAEVVEFGEFIGFEPMRCPNCNHIAFNPYDEYDHCGAYCAAKGLNITCWGCREDQPNQLAHVDYGGCLYDASKDTEKED